MTPHYETAVHPMPEAPETSENSNTLPPLPDAEGQWQPLVASASEQSSEQYAEETALNQETLAEGISEYPALDPALTADGVAPRVLRPIPEEENLTPLPVLPFVGFLVAMLIMV